MFYVYRFLDKEKNIIYVGKSKQELDERFSRHLHLPDECYNSVHKIEYIQCSTESDMSIKEIYYINKYKGDHFYFNVSDMAELPTSVVFEDKWKLYRGPLGSQFKKSINYVRGYTKETRERYKKDGSLDKRKSNKQKGDSSFVEGFTKEEVDLITKEMIKSINDATNDNKQQISFRNLVLFVLGINLPLRTNDLLFLKYKDLFNSNDSVKSIDMKLGRVHKDETIEIPLRKSARKVLIAYTEKYGLTYAKNSEDYLFLSRKHQVLSPAAWWRILDEATKAAGINKNIGAESVRKTYGLNVYANTEDKLNALLFLSELWGQTREGNIIKYLSLSNGEIDFNLYFGETYSLGNISLSKIRCLKKQSTNKEKVLVIENSQDETEKKPPPKPKMKQGKTNRKWTVEEKLEVVEMNLTKKVPQKVLAKEYNVDAGAISRWISAYKSFGKDGLLDKRQKSK